MKKTRKTQVLILAAVVALTLLPMGAFADEASNPFADVSETDWFANDVIYVYSNDYMGGTSTDPMLFSPKAPTTRSMAVTILYRMAGSPNARVPAADGGGKFSDVAEGAYYYDAVNWAFTNNIITGISDDRFAPNSNVTREQMAVILYNYANWAGFGPEGAWAVRLDYADADRISEWAIEGAMYVYMNSIISGKPGNIFDPKGVTSRAEFAAMLHRFLAGVKTGATFSVPEWLDNPDHAAAFMYIAVNAGPDNSGAVSESDQEFILGALKDVVFDAVQSPGPAAWDFAFGMNEPFMFFTFIGDSLFVVVPLDTGYADYAAQVGSYEGLSELRDYINKMRSAE